MTNADTIRNAQTAFVAALDAGVKEDDLIEAIFEATMERELCIDATRMVNRIFQADSEWLKRMCEEEIRQRDIATG